MMPCPSLPVWFQRKDLQYDRDHVPDTAVDAERSNLNAENVRENSKTAGTSDLRVSWNFYCRQLERDWALNTKCAQHNLILGLPLEPAVDLTS
jgi:hypothetical protein